MIVDVGSSSFLAGILAIHKISAIFSPIFFGVAVPVLRIKFVLRKANFWITVYLKEKNKDEISNF